MTKQHLMLENGIDREFLVERARSAQGDCPTAPKEDKSGFTLDGHAPNKAVWRCRRSSDVSLGNAHWRHASRRHVLNGVHAGG